MPLSTVAMDVRPGGAWRATMFCGPERREIRWTGEYREVAAPERLVFTISDTPGDDPYELVSVVLAELGDGRTEMRFEQRGHLRPDEYDRARNGWGALLRALDERLAGAGPTRTGAAGSLTGISPVRCPREPVSAAHRRSSFSVSQPSSRRRRCSWRAATSWSSAARPGGVSESSWSSPCTT